MAEVTNLVQSIRQAVYGADVRESLASGIETINTEVENTTARQTDIENIAQEAINMGGNPSLEVSQARGTFDNLGHRLNNVDSSLMEQSTQVSNLDIKKANKDEVNSLATEKASQADLLTQKGRIDNLVATPSSSFYEKTTNGTTGALLVVASGATTGQINLSSVTPVATGYTPIAGDYVRLVYGVSSGSSELIDIRTAKDGTIYPTAGGAVRGQIGDLKKYALKETIINTDYVLNITTTGGQYQQIVIPFSIENGKKYCFSVDSVVNSTTSEFATILFLNSSGATIDRIRIYNAGSEKIHFFTGTSDMASGQIVLRGTYGNTPTVNATATWSGVKLWKENEEFIKSENGRTKNFGASLFNTNIRLNDNTINNIFFTCYKRSTDNIEKVIFGTNAYNNSDNIVFKLYDKNGNVINSSVVQGNWNTGITRIKEMEILIDKNTVGYYSVSLSSSVIPKDNCYIKEVYIEALKVNDNHPKAVIFDADFDSDVDDAAAVRIVSWAERHGMIDLVGVCLSNNNTQTVNSVTYYGASAMDSLLCYDGLTDVCIGVNRNKTYSNAMYYSSLNSYYHKIQNNSECEDSVDFYRRALASLPEGEKCEIIVTGFLVNISRLLNSSADKYSDLTGLELFNKKVSKTWVMGGRYDIQATSRETNLASTNDCVSATYDVLTKASCPIVFLGQEFESVLFGASLISNNMNYDALYQALLEYNTNRGWTMKPRFAWDPMTVLMACIGTDACGLEVTQGTNSIDNNVSSPTYGINTFIQNATGNHYYVEMRYSADCYKNMLDNILEKRAWSSRTLGRVRLKRLQ